MSLLYFLPWLGFVVALPTLLSPRVAELQQLGLPVESGIEGWLDPRDNGGRFLDYTTPKLGEPLNVIISSQSDPYILTEAGFHSYAKSIGYSEECLGLHVGQIHYADLGDGRGRQPEQFLARQYYFPVWGTCWESFAGGNHFRAWQQGGTGAWFISASKEENYLKHHTIADNGWNLGRDWLVDRAVPKSSWKGVWWKAEVEWRGGLLEPGNKSINHGIPQDGLLAILTVQRTTRPSLPSPSHPSTIFHFFPPLLLQFPALTVTTFNEYLYTDINVRWGAVREVVAGAVRGVYSRLVGLF